MLLLCFTIHTQLAGAEKKLSRAGGGGWVVAEAMWWVGVVGLAENKANSAPIELELELGLSLAKGANKELLEFI